MNLTVNTAASLPSVRKLVEGLVDFVELHPWPAALVEEARHFLLGLDEPGSFAVRYANVRERESAVATAHAQISKCFE